MAAKKSVAKKNNAGTPKPAESPLQLMRAFPTIVGARQFKDVEKLNDALRLSVHRQRGSDPEGLYRSNSAGTWHSDDAIFRWAGDAGKELADMFGETFQSYARTHGAESGALCEIHLQAWAMLYTAGGYSTVHTHPNCHFSGVYYLDESSEREITMATGVQVHPGDIEFVDTRGVNGMQKKPLNFGSSFRITPKPGLMLVFPSWLPHFVHPITEGERISVACNATILKYEPPKGK